jgi:hypothetical protein
MTRIVGSTTLADLAELAFAIGATCAVGFYAAWKIYVLAGKRGAPAVQPSTVRNGPIVKAILISGYVALIAALLLMFSGIAYGVWLHFHDR